nr:hypothetical protein [uncultured Gellertiella sp.]
MRYRFSGVTVTVAGLLLVAAAHPAAAMTLKECSTKYQAAKKDGTLNNRDWNTFRATDCATAASAAAPAAVPAAPAATPAAPAATPAVPATQAATPAAPAKKPAAPLSTAILTDLPTAIDPKYAAQKPSQGRLHTCADSYKAHKAAGTLQGLRWIQKGGGFYSQCNRKLKGG